MPSMIPQNPPMPHVAIVTRPEAEGVQQNQMSLQTWDWLKKLHSVWIGPSVVASTLVKANEPRPAIASAFTHASLAGGAAMVEAARA